MKKFLISISLFLITSASAIDLTFDKKPLAIRMGVQQEIIISFDEQLIDFNIKSESTKKKLNLLWTPENTLYITPSDEIDKTRVIAGFANGSVVILDLETVTSNVYKEVNIHLENSKKKTAAVVPESLQDIPDFLREGYIENAKGSPKITYKTMTQFAIRHFSGPSRLINDLPATKTSFSRRIKSSDVVRIWSSRLTFKGLAQWQIGDSYVMATLVSNQYYDPYQFDPRAIKGDFDFVAALDPVIEPKGSLKDQTVWVFISKTPFQNAIGGI